jgi:hypothetical protein
MIRLTLAVAMLTALSEPLLAQHSRSRPDLTSGDRPPAGLCRIWLEGVPASRQPSPTDCATAVRNRPSNGRVIRGDDVRNDDDGWSRGRDDDKHKDNGKHKGHWKHGDRDDRRYGRDDDDRDDRDWNRGRRDQSGRDCVDRDRNGRCDYVGRSSDYCLDRNHDGRCDYVSGAVRNAQLPDMVRGALIDRGLRSADQRRWLGDSDVRGRYSDWDRNGIPERINWLDGAGRLVQQWVDGNRDGQADVVRLYQAGELVRVVQR